MHKGIHSSELGHYTDEILSGRPLLSCDDCFRDYLKKFEDNQTKAQIDKWRDDNDTWDLFNKPSDHICGVDFEAVVKPYKFYI